MTNIDFSKVATPAYVVDEALLEKNCRILRSVAERTGCRVLLAQKAFSMYSQYPMMAQYLDGTTASGLYELRLGKEYMGIPFGRETHCYAPAYKEEEFIEIARIADHIVFNNLRQYEKFRKYVKPGTECGIRVNPEYSEIDTDIYNPCFTGSRLGTTLSLLEEDMAAGLSMEGISGLHFHTMCEQNSDTLQRTLEVFEEKFGRFLYDMKWVNFGGGHHVTRADYDIEKLIECIERIQRKYNVTVYIEPGEAVALNAGYLVTQVLDTGKNGTDYAIVDTSAACHMPDVLEMPYRPNIIGAGMPGEKAYTYRLGGPTCLAGDIIGDYSFDEPLKCGDRLVFCDMAIYTMVKNNTFNGIRLPDIVSYNKDKGFETVKTFGYEDFKIRL